jgi:hypothetical protein
MDEFLYDQLTDSSKITQELIKLIEQNISVVQSLKEKCERGDSNITERILGKDIIAKLNDIDNRPLDYLKTMHLSQDNMVRAMPSLIAENYKRLLNFIISRLEENFGVR